MLDVGDRAGDLGPGRDRGRPRAGHAGRLLSAGPRAGAAARAVRRFRHQHGAADADGIPVGCDGPAAYARRGDRRVARRRTRWRRHGHADRRAHAPRGRDPERCRPGRLPCLARAHELRCEAGRGRKPRQRRRRRHHRRRREAGRRIHRPGNARGPRLQPIRGRGHARPAVGKRDAPGQCASERGVGDECRLVDPAEPGTGGQRGAFASRAQPRAAWGTVSIARRAPGTRCPAPPRGPFRRTGAAGDRRPRRRYAAPRPRDGPSARHRGASGGHAPR